MGKRLALVLLEQQDTLWQPLSPEIQTAAWPAMPALFPPWNTFQALAEAWMRLLTGLWSWIGTPLPRGV